MAAAAAVAGGLGALALAAPSPAGASSHGSTTVKLTSHSGYGKILVTSSGMSVYVFTADAANKSNCTGACLSLWPPVTVKKGTKPTGGPGVQHLGTIPDGSKLQVTWNKHPLYTYTLDTSAGMVNGNGVMAGSHIWYVATSSRVTSSSSGSGSTPTTAGSSGGSGGSGGYGY
jgi:predicted lipoprotein with Yx(FWY)xxD motif